MRDLLNDIRAHTPADIMEERDIARLAELIEDQRERCFYRDYFNPGHITGSALLISRDGGRVLMNHHKFLKKWLCFGGHADGDMNTLAVAIRETIEESGIENIKPLMPEIVDIDIHQIPRNPRKDEPIHFHYDVRYILHCNDNEEFQASEESNDLRWCGYDEAMALVNDFTMCRLLTKWKTRL
jgi:8-oxo-dGTP pyrophosphatase MutT (NUDIX family)